METASPLTFVCALERITLTEDYGRGDQFTDCLRITNSPSPIQRYLRSRDILASMGSIEVMHLFKSPAYVWAHYTSGVDPANASQCLSILDKHLYELRIFMDFLWIVKDNCVDFDKGFLFVGEGPDLRVSSNSLARTSTFASGLLSDPVRFTRDELRLARELYRAVLPEGIQVEPSYDTPKHQPYGKEYDALSRFFYFLAAARTQTFVPVKIAHYCTCLEALFLRDNTELSFKLAQRAACFATGNPAERLRLFALIKRVYDIRSKTVHGATIKADPIEAIRLSTEIDLLLRHIVRKIMDSNELASLFREAHQHDFEQQMNELVFGVREL